MCELEALVELKLFCVCLLNRCLYTNQDLLVHLLEAGAVTSKVNRNFW